MKILIFTVSLCFLDRILFLNIKSTLFTILVLTHKEYYALEGSQFYTKLRLNET